MNWGKYLSQEIVAEAFFIRDRPQRLLEPTTISGHRTSARLGALLTAAGNRLEKALRVIEECLNNRFASATPI